MLLEKHGSFMKTLIVMCPYLSFLWAAMLQTRYVMLTRLIVTNLMRKGLSLSADADNEPQRDYAELA